MAQKRMFTRSIIDSDTFLDMSQSTQNLYFHLGMRADDDGFIDNPKSIMRTIGANNDDMKVLIAKNYLITFESGVMVVVHWLAHNYIRNDRYSETKHLEEKNLLALKKNKEYRLKTEHELATVVGLLIEGKEEEEEEKDGIPSGIPTVDGMDTQIRVDKSRLNKIKLESNICVDENHQLTPTTPNKPKPTKRKKADNQVKNTYGLFQRVKLTDEQFEKLADVYGCKNRDYYINKLDCYIEQQGKDKYKSHYATVIQWFISDKIEPLTEEQKKKQKEAKEKITQSNEEDCDEAIINRDF